MKFLLVTLGSLGDLLPFLGLADALRQRRHQVVIASNAGYAALVHASGFEFTAIWQREQQSLDALISQDPAAAWRAVRTEMFDPAAGPTLEWIARHAAVGSCAVIASWTAFGARLAHQKLGVPLCNIYLSPGAAQQDDARLVDGATLRNLGLFPGWFGEVPGVQTCEFPLLEDAQLPLLPPELEVFLRQGPPPVIFTPGSFMRGADRFFRESLLACERLSLRAVFLTPYREHLPSHLPTSVMHFSYVALQRLAPRSAAMVHHGGIGTAAQGLRAGLPQLVTPLFFDQPDNAARLEALGVGQRIEHYQQPEVGGRLEELLASQPVRDNCTAVRARFSGANPLAQICDLAEAMN
jgi:rhamnosyltransferase subunit B